MKQAAFLLYNRPFNQKALTMSVRDQMPEGEEKEAEDKYDLPDDPEKLAEMEEEDLNEKIGARDDGFPSDDQFEQWWREHKETPEDDYEARNKILKGLDGYIHTAVKPYNNAPESALKQEVEKNMVNAIERWDPDQAPLRSWVWQNVFPNGDASMSVANKIDRKYGGTKKVNYGHMGDLEEARKQRKKFKRERGREPSEGEMADMLGVGEDYASKIMRQESETHFTDQLIDDNQSFSDYGEEESDALQAVYSSSSGRTKRIMEMLFWPDLGGTKPEHYDGNENRWPVQKLIAEEIGVSPATVSRERDQIRNRVKNLI